ncbi:hypothetical protein ScPMuIL_006273 [Solemya velum]
MLPLSDGANEHQIDYKQKYKALKKKLKFLVYEQECFLEELRKAQRKLLKISRDRSFLLDRLLQYEKVDESSGDSDATASSDSEAEGVKDGISNKRKRAAALSSGQTHIPIDPTLLGISIPGYKQGPGGLLIPTSESSKKKSKSTRKSKTSTPKGAGSKGDKSTGQMTREELERHLESKKHAYGIEKAPAKLPMDLFSSDNSNPDSDGAIDMKDDDDNDLVIDASQ